MMRIENKRWFQSWMRNINKELGISPKVEINYIKSFDEYIDDGIASGNNIIMNIRESMSEESIRSLYAHEARHIWQFKFKPDTLWNEKDRRVLIKALIKHDIELSKMSNRVARKKFEEKYHELLPEEVDAKIYAYTKTGYKE